MSRSGLRPAPVLTGDSFLRSVDPRTKLVLALAASTAVALPLTPLVFVSGCFASLLAAAGLARPAAAQLWRARLWFTVLFLLDWFFVGLGFATLITLRLALLSSAFILVFASTTADELRLAGERLWLPPRLAFAFATAFRSLGLVEREWRGIFEAQAARGIVVGAGARSELHRGRSRRGRARRWQPRQWRVRKADLARVAALVVPAVVLAAQRAWAISEAAAARGFESPQRRAYRILRLGTLDHALLVVTAAVLGGALLMR
jgi:energy-coupling factor transporter transmembrane protein EcfT